MDTANTVGLQSPTERVVHEEVSSSIEANGGLIRPLHVGTVVGKDGEGAGEVGYDHSLEAVGLCLKDRMSYLNKNTCFCLKYVYMFRTIA